MSSSAANKEHIEKDADHGSASFLYSCKEQRIILETEASLQNLTARCFDNGMAMEVDLKRVNINLENLKVQYDNAQAMMTQLMSKPTFV